MRCAAVGFLAGACGSRKGGQLSAPGGNRQAAAVAAGGAGTAPCRAARGVSCPPAAQLPAARPAAAPRAPPRTAGGGMGSGGGRVRRCCGGRVLAGGLLLGCWLSRQTLRSLLRCRRRLRGLGTAGGQAAVAAGCRVPPAPRRYPHDRQAMRDRVCIHSPAPPAPTHLFPVLGPQFQLGGAALEHKFEQHGTTDAPGACARDCRARGGPTEGPKWRRRRRSGSALERGGAAGLKRAPQRLMPCGVWGGL